LAFCTILANMSHVQSLAALFVVASCLLVLLAPTAQAGDYDGWSQGKIQEEHQITTQTL
jgi:hypothetical protein